MLRRLATALLVIAVALGGLTSVACASGTCAQVSGARMKCCAGEGLRADRNCCGSTIAAAAPQSAAAFERVPQVAPLAALPALLLPAAPSLPGRTVAAVPARGLGPPRSLIALHTSLLL